MSKVFKIAVQGNTDILKEQGIWGLPSSNGCYRAFVSGASQGDRVIFTEKGDPVVTGIVRSAPTSDLTMQFPDERTYTHIFTVNVKSQGRVARKTLKGKKVVLKRGVVSYSDKATFETLTEMLAKPTRTKVSRRKRVSKPPAANILNSW